MIRYTCPHCQRACESAAVLRGFTVFCLGCRQPVKVPDESTLPDAAPPPPKIAVPPTTTARAEIADAPAPPPPRPAFVAPPPPPKPIPPPPPPVKPNPVAAPRPAADADPGRRRVIRLALLGLLAVLLAIGGMYARSWYSKRQANRARIAEEQRVESLKDSVRDGFTPDALRRLSAKISQWEMAPAEPPRLKGKAVVLSFADGAGQLRSFWRDLLSAWPGQSPPSDAALIRELFERGEVDDLTFELPEERWAQGAGEVGSVVGIRWRKEVATIYPDGKSTDTTDLALTPEMVKGVPAAVRWRASVLLLDRPAAKLTARAEFAGVVPKLPPEDGKSVTGLKPLAEVRKWLIRAEIGKSEPGP